jgi:hypothetical protein
MDRSTITLAKRIQKITPELSIRQALSRALYLQQQFPAPSTPQEHQP